MLIKLHDLTTLATETPGGEAAKIRGAYVTPEMTVSLVAVDMAGLMDLRTIAIPAGAFGTPDVEAGTWPVDLTTDAISQCDPVGEKPKSALQAVKEVISSPLPEMHNTLRSADSHRGLSLDLNEGPAGRILDLVIDTDNMSIPFIVVETGSWLPDRQVLVPTAKLRSIDWENRTGNIDATQADIKSAPDVYKNDQLTSVGSGTLLTYYGISA